MKVLALEVPRPDIPGSALAPFLKEEASRVWELHQKGVVREIYFRADRNDAVLILEARDADEAQRILSTLPLVREHLIAFEIVPLVPYSGFERLFRDRVD
jgi:muconolactone delta-isomerase